MDEKKILRERRDKLLHLRSYDDGKKATPEERKKANLIKQKMNDLERNSYASIIICKSCGSVDKDMVYSKELNEWHCLECSGKNLDYWINAKKI